MRAGAVLRAALGPCLALILVAAPLRAQDVPPPKAGVLNLGIAQSGVIGTILVAEGARVTAGQPLLRLDCAPLEKDVAFRDASLAEAEAAFERARNGPRPEEIAIGDAAAGVATARADEARDALARANAMEVGVSVTRAQLLVVERDSRVADAQLLDAQKKLALLHAGSRPEDIAEAKAKRDAAAAWLDEGKATLDQCTLHAPAAGTVHFVATLGQFVSANEPGALAQLTVDGR